LHVDTILLALTDLEIYGWVRSWSKKIAHMLVIHLKVGDLHVVAGVGSRFMRDSVEQLLASAWDQTWVVWRAHHGVTFSGTCLAVCKDTCVVSLEVVVQELLTKGAVDVLLMCVMRVGLVMRPVRAVEREFLVIVCSACV
jgi:hypothetical protein